MALPVIPLAPVTKATFPLAGAMILNVYAYDSLIGKIPESLDRQSRCILVTVNLPFICRDSMELIISSAEVKE
jgi:hypothetical protein